ncbi:MAG: thermonuclease family protein [Nanoarchaeota archaeon]|nr:thermonuclease family protein [Nanoarchaeota archaeon]
MKIRNAVLLAILVVYLIASTSYLIHFQLKSPRQKIVVGRVIDGDTFVTNEGVTIRLLNINTPEKGESGSEEAKSFLKQFENKTVEIELLKEDKYHRTLARIYGPEYINLEIVEKGLAKKFLVDNSELSAFSKAESSAVSQNKGMWSKSSYFSCISVKVNPQEESASIRNKCTKIDITGWKVKDESRKEYKFEHFSLGGVNLHSKEGVDNATDLFWGNKDNIWNNDRDTLYLLDSEGKIVSYYPYGY